MKYFENTLELGIAKPFRFLHVSDTHIHRADERDSEELRMLAAKRDGVYASAEEDFSDISGTVREKGLFLIGTGDMMDFMSNPNREFITEFRENNNCFLMAGNHDFRPMGGMGYDVPASRSLNYDTVSKILGTNPDFDSFVINDVNFVAIDDVYYRFTETQYLKLEQEVKKGLPIILLLHIPIFHIDIYNKIVNENRKYASLVSVPESLMLEYPEKRYIQQKEDRATEIMTRYILSEPMIKAVICGHLHKDIEVVLNNRIPEIVTGRGTLREFYVK